MSKESRNAGRIPFKQIAWFCIRALDKIYNESSEARVAVEKHYGLYHHPYNEKFRRYYASLKNRNSQIGNRKSKR